VRRAGARRLFIQYYPRFTRFEAKAFRLEAVRFMHGVCPVCVIDNTSVLLAAGAGADAVVAPEMAAFARTLGFRFRAHRVGNPERKGRIERPFAYVETNFLAGRNFDDFDDLNRQALAWCRDVANHKPKQALGMSPEAAYLIERPHLVPLPDALPPVYELLERVVDPHGYVSVDTNRYSVPERYVGKSVAVYKIPAEIHVCRKDLTIAVHRRLIGERDAKSTLPGHHTIPVRQGRATAAEDALLAGHHPSLDRYAVALKRRGSGGNRRALRRLIEMKRTYPDAPFIAAIEQALRYGLFDLGRLEDLILKQVAGDFSSGRTMMRDKLRALIDQLRLHGMAEALDAELARAEREAIAAPELLYRLLGQEAASRRERSLAYRLMQARLPWRWSLDSFPFDRQPGVSKAQIQTLAGLDFLRRADNVLLIGKPGTGKTGLGIGLLREACLNGYRGRFYNAQVLLDELYASLADRTTTKLLGQLSRMQPLLIDELGYLTIKPEQANAFFRLMDQRYSRVSTIITTNLDLPDWYALFDKKPLVDALLDRLQHHCITIRIDGPSLRSPDLPATPPGGPPRRGSKA
jgi:DNA replication protein DnaC